jgi:hypothetical protein
MSERQPFLLKANILKKNLTLSTETYIRIQGKIYIEKGGKFNRILLFRTVSRHHVDLFKSAVSKLLI